MKRIFTIAVAAGMAMAAASPAVARDGCGLGGHRGPYGGCRPNRGPGAVIVAPGLVIGNYYPHRGYWDGDRYRHQRYRFHGGWRYR